jgi:hypothetical protein
MANQPIKEIWLRLANVVPVILFKSLLRHQPREWVRIYARKGMQLPKFAGWLAESSLTMLPVPSPGLAQTLRYHPSKRWRAATSGLSNPFLHGASVRFANP